MILEHAHFYGRTGYVILENDLSKQYLADIDYGVFVKVIKSITDFLAEKSGTIGLTVYYDRPEVSELVQFRIRASREASNIDLRTILADFSISDGGGHAGAIGFRIPAKDIPDLQAYVAGLLKKIESL
jgi:nanoRNase/pAp phosphatase (c-di-AMP/oligoRNAs hydrolase)